MNICEFDASLIKNTCSLQAVGHKDYTNTLSQIQNLTNNEEIEKSQNKSHPKISKFTVS